LRRFLPNGPLVNSEYYTGWLDFWNSSHSRIDTKLLVNKFNKIMSLNANVNFYMFHGGTNFGFLNGADPTDFTTNSINYLPQPTSYDFDAPISEGSLLIEFGFFHSKNLF
jgi:beta-galactosidase